MAVLREPDRLRVLVVNAGSSGLKLSLLGPGDEVIAAGGGNYRTDPSKRGVEGAGLIAAFLGGLDRADLDQVGAVGHRIVHGGDRFRTPVLINEVVRAELAELGERAPLHQQSALAGVDAVRALLPGVPAVGCFDTAFHATLPAAAATYALPAEWRERWGLRRYGFHGLSHAYAARRAAELLGRSGSELRVVTCHLGAGASLCAVLAGRSVDTTMGFTPLEGLVMATRSGSVDPGLLLWLQRHGGLGVDELAGALEHSSGLAGLAGGSGDMREVQEAADGGDGRAVAAIEVYVHRLRREIAAMSAAMEGIDALVFTGGVGEHQPAVRAGAASGLGFLGVAVDTETNLTAVPDTDVSTPAARVRTLVVAAREDVEITRQVRALVAAGSTARGTAGSTAGGTTSQPPALG